MSSDLRAELAALVAAYDEHGGYRPTPAAVDAMFAAMKRARAALAAPTPPADGKGEIPGEVRAAFAELERCEENLRGFRQLRADLAAPTPSLAELVNPQPGYQPGTRLKAGAQLVQGANGPDWLAPEFGSDSLDATLEAIRDRIAPYLREPVAGVDVPGPDGDYGGLVELCRAQGVDPELGVPLLQRARKAWDVGTALPADGEAEELAGNLESVAGHLSDIGCDGYADYVNSAADYVDRAAALLRESRPQPVPVAQRPPGPEDCDAERRCWIGCSAQADQTDDFNDEYISPHSWELTEVHPQDQVWLPHGAIPIPTEPTTTETTNG